MNYNERTLACYEASMKPEVTKQKIEETITSLEYGLQFTSYGAEVIFAKLDGHKAALKKRFPKPKETDNGKTTD